MGASSLLYHANDNGRLSENLAWFCVLLFWAFGKGFVSRGNLWLVSVRLDVASAAQRTLVCARCHLWCLCTYEQQSSRHRQYFASSGLLPETRFTRRDDTKHSQGSTHCVNVCMELSLRTM